jgi:hypothetical protein
VSQGLGAPMHVDTATVPSDGAVPGRDLETGAMIVVLQGTTYVLTVRTLGHRERVVQWMIDHEIFQTPAQEEYIRTLSGDELTPVFQFQNSAGWATMDELRILRDRYGVPVHFKKAVAGTVICLADGCVHMTVNDGLAMKVGCDVVNSNLEGD